MSSNDFARGECGKCGGHLEFPANAAGRTVVCPHCGGKTVLPSPPCSGGKVGRFGLTALLVFAVLLAVFFLMRRPAKVSPPPSLPSLSATNQGISTNPSPIAPPASGESLQPGETGTNDFGISGGVLEKTAGSSLVYVVGTVRNLTDRQRFGVKVDYSLFDDSGKMIGHATDYQSVIDPKGAWVFHAMVMESKTVSASLGGITEER